MSSSNDTVSSRNIDKSIYSVTLHDGLSARVYAMSDDAASFHESTAESGMSLDDSRTTLETIGSLAGTGLFLLRKQKVMAANRPSRQTIDVPDSAKASTRSDAVSEVRMVKPPELSETGLVERADPRVLRCAADTLADPEKSCTSLSFACLTARDGESVAEESFKLTITCPEPALLHLEMVKSPLDQLDNLYHSIGWEEHPLSEFKLRLQAPTPTESGPSLPFSSLPQGNEDLTAFLLRVKEDTHQNQGGRKRPQVAEGEPSSKKSKP